MKALLAAALLLLASAAPGSAKPPPPAAAVGPARIAVPTPAGTAELAAFATPAWGGRQPGIRRAIIIVHGIDRDADVYRATVLALLPAGSDAGRSTLVIAPQFIAPEDAATHALPGSVLRWRWDRWASGEPALGPAPVSSFAALDALLGALADRTRLPDLREVVIAGFSAGGQLVQRYAAVGHGAAVLRGSGLHLRYVVGSPSSYVYFTGERIAPDGRLGAFADAARCPDYDAWRYGFAGKLPAYVGVLGAAGIAQRERAYAADDIVYLVGGDDNNPNHRWLDKSCAGEAEGPTRYARALAFFATMRQRDGTGLGQSLHIVAGAGHNERRVLGSPCGRAALLGGPGCPGVD